MTDPFQIHLLAAMLACILAGALGALLGLGLAWIFAEDYVKNRLDARVIQVLHSALVKAGAALVGEARCEVKLKQDDGSLSHLSTIALTAPELHTQMVDRWLEQRGLVAAPKGKDFKVPVKAGAA